LTRFCFLIFLSTFFFSTSISFSKSDLEKCADTKYNNQSQLLEYVNTPEPERVVYPQHIRTKDVLYTYFIYGESEKKLDVNKIGNKFYLDFPIINPLIVMDYRDPIIIETRNEQRKTFPVRYSHKELMNSYGNLETIPHIAFSSEEEHKKFRLDLPKNINEYNKKKEIEMKKSVKENQKEIDKFLRNNLKTKLNDSLPFYQRFFVECQDEKERNKELFKYKY